MTNEHLEKLLEELDGKIDLGMDEDALALCEHLLSEAENLNAAAFHAIGRAIGMFADDTADWLERLSIRHNALNEEDQLAVSGFWTMFFFTAGVPWSEIKPHVSLRQLPGDCLLKLCLCAIEAKDESWCREASSVLENICAHHSAGSGHRLAQAALLCESRDHLAALAALRGFKVESCLFEDYFGLLTNATMTQYLESLKTFEGRIAEVEDRPNAETELSLPGNELSRFAELRQSIAAARGVAEGMIRG